MNLLNLIIWVNFITENLFKDNEFLNYCRIADSNVKEGKIVVLPQVGSVPVVIKNRSSVPATVSKRTDTSIVYVIDEFTTDPTLIPDADQYELSYDKMSSVLGDHMDVLKQSVADNLIYEWVRDFSYTGAGTTVAAPVIRTTGAATASHLESTTGTRKAFIKENLQKMKLRFDKQGIPKNDRFALVPSDMMDQLLSDADLKVRDGQFGGELDMKNGVIQKMYGFTLIDRASTVAYTTAGVVKAPGAVAVATDCDAVVCWQKNCVERAMGEVKMFQDQGNPLYYGDIYSALVRFGGRKTRINAEGIGVIVQDN